MIFNIRYNWSTYKPLFFKDGILIVWKSAIFKAQAKIEKRASVKLFITSTFTVCKYGLWIRRYSSLKIYIFTQLVRLRI